MGHRSNTIRFYSIADLTFNELKIWYGILEFNVPLDRVSSHFGDGGPVHLPFSNGEPAT